MRPRQTSAKNSSMIIQGNIWIKSPSGNEALTEDRAAKKCYSTYICVTGWAESLRFTPSLNSKGCTSIPCYENWGVHSPGAQRSRQRQKHIFKQSQVCGELQKNRKVNFKVITKAVSAQVSLRAMEVFCLNLQALGSKHTTPRRAERWGVGVRMGEQINQQLKINQVG